MQIIDFIAANWIAIFLFALAATGLGIIVFVIRAYHGEGETETTEGAEAIRGKRIYAEAETLDVAKLYREGITREALRVTVRDLRAHGTKVTLINRPGLHDTGRGVKGWITSRGRFIAFTWGGK